MTTRARQWFRCPWCQTLVAVAIPPAQSADEFCPECDFPMFWAYVVEDAAQAARTAEAEPEDQAPTREVREPEAPPNVEHCSQCGHANPVGAQYCSNCGANLVEEAEADTSWVGWVLLAIVLILVVAAVAVSFWPF